MAEVKLKVNGREYGGWKTARVTRGIESVSGSFEVAVSERWANQRQRWPFKEDDECTVEIGGVTLVTGFVFNKKAAYSATDHSVRVSGRDKTADLVDCSVYDSGGKWEFQDLSLLKFAEKLCKPHGVKVSLQSGLSLPKPPKKYVVTPGTKVFHALEEACRVAGVLPVSDGQGGLLLTRAGTKRCSVELVEGGNILAASSEFDVTDRFHDYHVIGQHHGASDDFMGEDAAHVKAKAEDPNVRSSRVCVVRPEHNVTPESAKKRAQWEATTRAARGDVVTVTVQGWTQGKDKPLWPINALVRVRSPEIFVNGDMLICQADYTLNEEGTMTVLHLKRPDAFKPEPTVSKSTDYWKEIVKGV